MSTIGLFIGSENAESALGVEDTGSTLRLSALAASWAASNGHTILALGDGPALLALGTAVVGLQQGRVLEGGERRRSPLLVLALLTSENAERDRSLSFQRRAREAPGEKPSTEETPERDQEFGDLSLLVDLGIMDIVGDSQLSLLPKSPETLVGTLREQLFIERPEGILAIGQVPEAVSRIARGYTREMQLPFACALSHVEGAVRLTADAELVPRLDNRILRFRGRESSSEKIDEDIYDTADEEVMRAARQATWEAELTFRIYQWLTSISG